MKNHFGWVLVPAVLGAFLFFSQPSIAQQSTADQGQQGQQGEFEGEHTDTGAAGLDTGTEAKEAPEGVEANESVTTAGQAADSSIDLQESTPE